MIQGNCIRYNGHRKLMINNFKTIWKTNMEHINETVDFKGVQKLDEFKLDEDLVQDPCRDQDLIRWVRTGYRSKISKSRFFAIYLEMINLSIKSNNLKALNILWNGIYYHDRDNPDFLSHLYTAAEFGNLQMFQHCLYAYKNYAQLNEPDEINMHELLNLAGKNVNKDVLDYIRVPSTKKIIEYETI